MSTMRPACAAVGGECGTAAGAGGWSLLGAAGNLRPRESGWSCGRLLRGSVVEVRSLSMERGCG